MCLARTLRSEVKVLTWSPDRGNPTSTRQGRGPELTGRSQCGWLRCGASARAGLKEAIDASWWRTKVKRLKAFLGGVSRPLAAMPDPYCWIRGRSGRRDYDEISAFHPRRSAGSRPDWPVGRRTKRTTARWPSRSPRIASYRKAAVMAAERAGSSPGGQGKAIPVEETAVQRSMPIATAETRKGPPADAR